ncbi:ribose-phosphate pyrophosphokinase [Permianibacter sp. IMCC34836]|uniref:ribose-phosphate pyrophosphokinase n=1 Tax=Permianibacter fluminis TaxID=2738515 RepID=UPI0015525C3A|nr:ribose-phosphate pyrophosphokinase [Permianibacter fluminis]NQD38007.1 ribose-phosphate pyrophosphokinase [Permianibacter fluminis]
MSQNRLLFTLDGNASLQQALQQRLSLQRGDCEIRHFPDGESYVRVHSDCRDSDVAILCNLHDPDRIILPLLFLVGTLRELGAKRVGLLAPYLAYMRQDARFNPGEAISSRHFAALLSGQVDWLVTVDPHLHRFNTLSQLYTIPSQVVYAAPLVAEFIRQQIHTPLLIGPDQESEQWVAAIAADVGCPYQVLQKKRHGDREVEVSLPQTEHFRQHTPVLLDDMVSTGHTMLAAIGHLKKMQMQAPVCVATHGLFVEEASQRLLAAGAERVISCNSVPHASNAIDLSPVLVPAVQSFLSM